MMNDQNEQLPSESSRPRTWKKIAVLLMVVVGLTLTFYSAFQFFTEYRKATTLPALEFLQRTPQERPLSKTQQTPKMVYGFLPYWTMKTAQIPRQLSNVAYFSVSLRSDGSIQIKLDGERDLGWYTLSSDTFQALRTLTRNQHQRLDLVITMMDADTISAFLTSSRAQQNAMTNIKMLMKTQPIDGINLDIEYSGDVTNQLRTQYAAFVAQLNQEMKRLDPESELSIDVFADAATKERIWDIPAVAPHVDFIIVMAYDFFRSSSPLSGPVAPLFGSGKNRWETDIAQNLKAYTDIIPPEKMVLGVPFYGYEWQTVSDQPGAATYPKSGGLATYKRVRKLIEDLGVSEQWDPDAFSPFITYTENGKTQTIYYENSRSLSYKLDLVNQANMGGIAIWALGYEGDSPEFWYVIAQKFDLRQQ